MKSSKQLREIEKFIDEMIAQDRRNMSVDIELNELRYDIRALLDSVREEYKGMIEQLRVNKVLTSHALQSEADRNNGRGWNAAVDELNRKIDEILKNL